jgi:hypothetical protein
LGVAKRLELSFSARLSAARVCPLLDQSVQRDTGTDGRGFALSAPKIFEPPWCQFGVAALGEAALQRKVTRLKEKSGFSSSLPPVRQLYRANFPPTQTPLPPAFFVGNRSSKRRDRMTDWVIRKFATDIDEPVLAEPRKGFFVRFMEALRETRRRQARREIAKHAHLLSNDSWR